MGLALSVASNLTLLFPCTGLAVIFLSILLIDRRTARQRFSLAVDSFVIPGVALAFVILILPVTKARMDYHFYVGQPSLAQTLESLVALSFFHHPISGGLTDHLPGVEFWFFLIGKVLVPLGFVSMLAVSLAAACGWLRGRTFSDLGRIDQFLLLAGAAMVLALGMTVVGHRAFGLLYPHGRTGFYLTVLHQDDLSTALLALPRDHVWSP